MEFRFWAKGCDWGRRREDAIVEELWQLGERIEVMERRGILPEWVSDEEEDYVEGVEPQGDVKLKRLFKSFLVEISRPRSEVRTYDGSLNAEELIN